MKVDLLLVPFGADWSDMRQTARWAEDSGFDGLWTWDHLSGAAYGSAHSLEAWTVVSALADATTTIAIGPMVLNVANRDPDTLAVMAATLQHISSGRLILGLGAGSNSRSAFSSEQLALGRCVASDRERRANVQSAVNRIRRTWALGSGFLEPSPHPPIVLGAHGPKMAKLAAETADGMDVESPQGEALELIQYARSVLPPGKDFLVSTRLRLDQDSKDFPSTVQQWITAAVDRVIIHIRPPYESKHDQLLSSLRFIRSS